MWSDIRVGLGHNDNVVNYVKTEKEEEETPVRNGQVGRWQGISVNVADYLLV